MRLLNWLSFGSARDLLAEAPPPLGEELPAFVAPTVELTPEGCFHPAEEFAWTTAAEADLARRLAQLG